MLGNDQQTQTKSRSQPFSATNAKLTAVHFSLFVLNKHSIIIPCISKQMQRITLNLFNKQWFLSINIYFLICRHKQPTFPVIVKQRTGKSIIALWDVSYIVKARCQPIVVMCIDWSEKTEPLFKAIQHSINTPFALWQSSTAASWLICLLLPCQSIMNHPLCHRTTLHSPAGRKREGGRDGGNGKKGGGRKGWEVEDRLFLPCWQRKMRGIQEKKSCRKRG